MKNFMLDYLNSVSNTDIKNLEVFTFTTGGNKRRFNGNILEFYCHSETYGDYWKEDPTKYNALLNCKIAR